MRRGRTGLLVLIACCAGLACAAPVRVAVVPVGTDARTELASEQIGQAVAGMPDCETLDRTAVGTVLKERSLAASGSAKWSEQLRKMLAADVFAFLEPFEVDGSPYIRLTLIETRSGAVLGAASAPANNAVTTLTEALKAALRKQGDLGSHGRYVAWLGAGSEESNGRLAGPAAALSALVGLDLVANPRLALLDRAHLDHLGDETLVGAADQELKRSVVVVEASLRPVGATREADAVIAVRTGAGTMLTSVVVRVDLNDLRGAGHRVASGIEVAFFGSALARAATEPPSSQEAALLAIRARQYTSWREWPRAIEMAEAAYALDHTQTNRLLLASVLFDAGDQDDNPLQFTRSTAILLEFYGVLANDTENALSHNPYFVFDWAHQRPEREPTGLQARNRGDVATPLWTWGYRARRTDGRDTAKEQVAWRELLVNEENLFRLQLSIGERIRTNDPSFYWRVWLARLRGKTSYCPGDTAAQIGLMRQAADECARQANASTFVPWETVDSAASLVNSTTVKAMCSSPEGTRLYDELTQYLRSSNDPLLRMAGCVGRLEMKSIGKLSAESCDAQAMGVELASIVANLPLDSPYRAYVKGHVRGGSFQMRELRLFSLMFGSALYVPRQPFHPGNMAGNTSIMKLQKRVLEIAIGTNQTAEVAILRKWAFNQCEDCVPTLLDSIWQQGWQADAYGLAQRLEELGRCNPVMMNVRPGFAQRYAPKTATATAMSQPVPVHAFTNAPTPWDDYAITRLGSGIKRPFSYVRLNAQEDGCRLLYLLPDNDAIDILDVCEANKKGAALLGIRLLRLSLPDGRVLYDQTVPLLPLREIDRGSLLKTHVFCATRDATSFYLGTDQGVFVIDCKTHACSLLDATKDLPGSSVRGMDVLGDRLYLALDPPVFASYELKTTKFQVLAAERTVRGQSPGTEKLSS